MRLRERERAYLKSMLCINTLQGTIILVTVDKPHLSRSHIHAFKRGHSLWHVTSHSWSFLAACMQMYENIFIWHGCECVCVCDFGRRGYRWNNGVWNRETLWCILGRLAAVFSRSGVSVRTICLGSSRF